MKDWSSQQVLVTGAGGFIGSHLAEELVRRGAAVRAFVHYNALGRRGWLDESPSEFREQMEIVAGDIREFHSVRRAMEGCGTVLHLAALIGIPYSYESPLSYVRTNIEGTLNVLEAARELGVDRVVQTSTSEVYGSAISVPITEAHPLQGQSPYSASKIGADHLAESYWRSFGVPVVIARPFNTFGPRQSARAIIPSVMAQLLSGGGRIEAGSLEPARDMNFVSNTVDGLIAAADAPDEALGEAINLGSGREVSIGGLIELIMSAAGIRAEIISAESRVRPEKSEVQRLVCGNEKARRLLGWSPAVSLEEGLELTLRWMRVHMDRYRPGEYVI